MKDEIYLNIDFDFSILKNFIIEKFVSFLIINGNREIKIW